MEIQQLIEDGYLFVVNHSGGKDSQAMFAKVAALVPADQIVVIHAVLPEVEWEGVVDHIRATIGDAKLLFAQAAKLAPDLYRRVVETEKRLGFTLSPSMKGLEDITGIAA